MSRAQSILLLMIMLVLAMLLVVIPPNTRLIVLVVVIIGYYRLVKALYPTLSSHQHDTPPIDPDERQIQSTKPTQTPLLLPLWLRDARWQVVICFATSAVLLSPYTLIPWRIPFALLFAIIGMLRLHACLHLSWLEQALPAWTTAKAPLIWTPAGLRWRWVVVALGLGLFATLQSLRPVIDLPVALSHHVQHGAWLGALMAMIGATDRLWLPPQPTHRMTRARRRRYAGWIAILLVGFAVRLMGVDDILRVPVDETIFMTGAMYFNDHTTVRLFHPMGLIDSVPRLYSYWVHLTSAIAGHNWFGLRLASIFIGTLTLPAMYLLAKALFNRRIAVLAMAFLAIFPPHVHFSRLAMIQIADVLAGTLALAVLVRAVRGGRGGDFVLAGVLLGTTQYFYDAGRLLYPLMVCLWLGRVVLMPVRSRSQMRKHIMSFMIAFGFMALPAYIGFWVVGYSVTNRAEVMVQPATFWAEVLRGGDALGLQAQRLLESIGRYVAIGEIPLNILQYDGQHPLILEPMIPFFLLGMGVLLWRWRSPVALLLALWLGGTAFGSSLLLNHASDSRYVVAFPALVLILALGLDGFVWGMGWAWQQGRMAMLRTAPKVAGAIILASGVMMMTYYFGELLPNLNSQILGYNYDGTDAMIRTANLPEDMVVVTITLPRVDRGYRLQEMAYFGSERPLFTYDTRDWQQLFDDIPAQQPLAIFIAAHDVRTLADLQAWFNFDAPRYSPNTHLPERYRLVLWLARDGWR